MGHREPLVACRFFPHAAQIRATPMSISLNTPRVVLDRITETAVTPSGAPYFAAYFKAGIFGRAVRRAFFGKVADDGTTTWDRAAPEDLASLVGQDLSGQVSIEPVAIEPVEYVSKQTGEVKAITSASIVRLVDETTEAAARIYGYTLRDERPVVAAGFHVVGGDGAVS